MQYPSEIAGVTNAEFIRAAINARRDDDDPISVMQFLQQLDQTMETLEMPADMADRYLNQGFSGGEKKRNEILQLMMIQPAFALLDEIDSGLDIDALRVVAKGVNMMRGPEFGSLIITHYQRLLDYIVPDVVHVMKGGRIIETGGPELALSLEKPATVTWKRRNSHVTTNAKNSIGALPQTDRESGEPSDARWGNGY